MRFRKLYHAVTANIGLKIVSLLFAVFLWLYVTAQIGERQTFRVPLALANIPESLTVVREPPAEIAVTLRSTRSELLKLRLLSTIKATVDLSAARGGRVIVPLSTAILNLPVGFKAEDAAIEGPKALTLDFERVVTVSAAVTPTLRGAVPKGMILVGRPAVTPDRVLVSGPASAMSAFTAVETEPIDLRNKRGKFSHEVSVLPGGRRRAVPSKVLVELEVSRRVSRTISGIPPTLLQGEEGLVIEYSPLAVALTVEGPEELVNRLVADDVSVILNIPPGARGVNHIQPEVLVPQGIDTFSLDVASFEVKIVSRR
jgi:YbbR domain-containing protein